MFAEVGGFVHKLNWLDRIHNSELPFRVECEDCEVGIGIADSNLVRNFFVELFVTEEVISRGI
jgi:hypothetical protein